MKNFLEDKKNEEKSANQASQTRSKCPTESQLAPEMN